MVDPVWIDGTTPLNSANLTKLQTRDEKGAVNGYAPLDATGKVPVAQLPAAATPPGTELAYAEITANVSIGGTVIDVVSSGAITYSGAPIMIEFFAAEWETPAVLGAFLLAYLWDGSTDLGQLALIYSPGSNTMGTPVYARRRLTPTAGSHTYRIRGYCSGGTGKLQAASGAPSTYVPAFIRVTTA